MSGSDEASLLGEHRWRWFAAVAAGVLLLVAGGLSAIGWLPFGTSGSPGGSAASAYDARPDDPSLVEADGIEELDESDAVAGADSNADAQNSPDAAGSNAAGPDADGLTAADRAAGLKSLSVPQSGSGKMVSASSTRIASPEDGRRIIRIAFKVEEGLDIEAEAFADFVLETLNDERSWAQDGYQFLDAQGQSARLTINLATPDTSARMCQPLRTFGKLSCRSGSNVVFTLYRWVQGIDEYSNDLTGYRHYLVNHEVGHYLGKGHQYCSGAGKPAPVMQQQTKGLNGCTPNSWPYP